jgi:hypothetical protein
MGGMGMPGGMMGGSPGTGPGLLGWEPEHYPLKIKVSPAAVAGLNGPLNRMTHRSIRDKAPTLPSALDRFYREPGPWMAVFLDNQWKIESIGSNEELQLHLRNSEYAEIKAVVKNARATYAAKEWMKLADYFTNAGQARELLQFYALQSRVDIALDEVAKRSDNYLTQELAKLPEIAATIHHEWNALNPSTQFEALSLQFRNIDPVGVDTRMVEAAQSFPSESLRKGFAIWGLMSSVFSESSALEPTSRTNIDIGLEFELASGEVSSYTESGDTASATLTIPDKPPVPIRFKRENDQWKIDAIGSNERLLERLRQTKAWKHVESVTSESSTPSSPPQEPSPLPVEEPTPLAEPIPVGGATGVQ